MGPVLRCIPVVTLAIAFSSPAAAQERIELGALDPVVSLTLGERPLVSIGDGSGPAHEFFEVGGAVELSDGRIAVLNGGTNEVRIFSQDGEHVASWGGTGDGPGEFRSAERLFVTRGDSLVVWDTRAARATILSPHDGFARAIALDPSPPAARLEGVDERGRLLIAAMRLTPSASPDIRRVTEDLYLHGPDGARISSLGEAPGISGVIRSSGERLEVLRPLVAPTTTYAFREGAVWIETGEWPEMRILDVGAGVSRIVEWQTHDLTLTDDLVQQVIEDQVAAVDDPQARSRLRNALEARPVPERLPATDRVIPGPAGRAWVQLARFPGADEGRVWVVFDATGSAVASVRVGVAIDIQSVSGNRVVVVERGPLDVELVRVYRLEPGS